MIKETLNEYAYDAECAGLAYQLYTTTTGMKLELSGYNHKMNVLLESILNAMVNTMSSSTLNEDRYSSIKQKYKLSWLNFYKAVPYQWCCSNRDYLLSNNKWHISEKLNAINNDELTTSAHLIEFSKRLLASIHVESLFMGNVTKEESKSMTDLVTTALGLNTTNHSSTTNVTSTTSTTSTTNTSNRPNMLVHRGREVKLNSSLQSSSPLRANCLHRMNHPNPKEENSAIEITYQIGCLDIKNEAILYLLFHLIKAPCFSTLRTKEQLGYSVWSGINTSSSGILSAWFIIQSKDYGPQHLDNRIEQFLEDYRNDILPQYNDQLNENNENNDDQQKDCEEGTTTTTTATTTATTTTTTTSSSSSSSLPSKKTTFETNVLACISKWSEKDKKLRSRTNRYSSTLASNKSIKEFNTRYQRALVLMNDGITLKDVIQCFDLYLKKDGKERRKLSCHVVAFTHLQKDNILVDEEFQKNKNTIDVVERIGESEEMMKSWKESKSLFPSIITRPGVKVESNL
jgi:secreted Zn-dependent insulinase-like peptidase